MDACTEMIGAPAAPTQPWITAARRVWRALHHGMSLVGLATVGLALLLASQPQLRAEMEQNVTQWLLVRQGLEGLTDNEADITGAEATTPVAALPAAQARMADWLARKYRVAAEPLAALVAEAHSVGKQFGLDPALLLAVMANESRFNPLAASPWGAHGLMQVLTRAHIDKFEPHGGPQAAFDPISNLRVGAQILHDAVRKAGSVAGGLRLYVGAITVDASDYVTRVLAEQERLRRVAAGQRVPFNAPVALPPLADLPPPPPLEALATDGVGQRPS
ncbi:MAG: transglycosylase SLT domain-containing protein [Tepidimonas ignava]|uniref:Membrane-bound lytic murein transglycosylase C n=1 Tax=Tepidimonas ignava TaxID=114249 RepID=A0A4R3LCU2_9BURK|nr:transglycosylase SLT domain-containing protein [Tepidimonas ignava]TCS97105.1 transglycosylase-like protein with SLT domain [Tepidimonas ignava]TSE22339.1 Membrane-bound lytic murein transglycosylase C [Tepidimonas ignava]